MHHPEAQGSDRFRRTLRHAFRRLARNPRFVLPTVTTLALGTGAVLALFVVVNRVVIRPLPYPDPSGLVRLWQAVPGVGPDARWGLGRPQFQYFRAQARSFEELGLYILTEAAVQPPRAPAAHAEEVRVAAVSASLFGVLGVRPAKGRPIDSRDNLAERSEVVLLSHAYWLRAFAGRPDAVGSTLNVNGRPLRVIGVLPQQNRLPEELQSPAEPPVSLWVSLNLDPAAAPTGGAHVFRAVGRLRAGASAEDAQRELAALTSRLPETLPGAYSPDFMSEYRITPVVLPLRSDVLGSSARVLWILLAVGAMVFLIAVVNATGLVLGEMEIRRGELGVRAAMGAGTAELAWLVRTEVAILVALATGLGLGLAALANRLLHVLGPSFLPRLAEARMGWPEAGAVLFLAVLTGTAVAALATPYGRGYAVLLRETGRTRGPSGGRRAPRGLLVACQLALSLVLVTGAGLLLASFRRLSAVEPGFDAEHALTLRLVFRPETAATPEQAAGIMQGIASGLLAVPGVSAAGMTSSLPMSGFDGCSSVFVEGSPGTGAPPCVRVHLVTPGYLGALRARVRGREPGWADVRSGAAGVMVSRALAARLWPGANAVGRRVRTSGDGPWLSVAAVVDDVREEGLDRPPSESLLVPVLPAAAILPVVGGPPRQMSVVLRTQRPLSVPELRRAVAEAAPGTAVADVEPLSRKVALSREVLTVSGLLLASACAVAVVVSAMGLYAVIDALVTRRRSELGVRMALGASRSAVGSVVVRDAVRITMLGIALGVPLALVSTRVLQAMLFEVSAADPVVLALTSGLLVVVAFVASALPAARAMRVDPAELLRHE